MRAATLVLIAFPVGGADVGQVFPGPSAQLLRDEVLADELSVDDARHQWTGRPYGGN
jgi:hypothetical protein